jgi:hypothetical protein
VRWTSAFTYLSIVALVGAVASQLVGSPAGRGWFLLAWEVFLLAVVIGLFGHPMRTPALGLFIGFFGMVAATVLIVLQVLAVANVLTGSAYGMATALPLAVVGVWILVASGLGFGAESVPALVDVLGLLAGAGLIAVSVTTLAGDSVLIKDAGLASAVAYCLWAAGIGWVFWRMQSSARSFRGVTLQRQG